MGNNPSYLWRSFLAARPALGEGLLWNIGNGKSVRIWTDKWLPKPSLYRVQSVRRGMEENALCTDKITWRCTKDEKFTVKSAYSLITEVESRSQGQTSTVSFKKELWPKIWKLGVPNATKMMIWRACHESLPTRHNLFKKKIVDSPLCPVCLNEAETVTHALWTCKAVQDVWGVCSRMLQKLKVTDSPFLELLSYMFSVLEEEIMEEVAATVYHVWKRRNQLVFEERFWSPEAVVKMAKQSMQEFKEVNPKQAVGLSQVYTNDLHWTAPPPNFIKANWDAAVDKIHCRIEIGVVLRDSRGEILASLRSPKDSFPDAHLAETIAALKAVILCQQLSLSHIILEGDAQQVVKDIQSSQESWNSAGMIVKDIKELLSKMSSWFVNFIHRSYNSLAHNVARDALKLSGESITLEEIPHCIHLVMI